MLTKEHAFRRFNSKMPSMRDDFARALRDLKSRFTKEQHLFDRAYIDAVRDISFDEIRKRYAYAAQCERLLIDDGWTPDVMNTIEGVYRDIFSSSIDFEYNHYSDIERALYGAMQAIGREHAEAAAIAAFQFEVGKRQVLAFDENVAELTMYKPQGVVHHYTFNAPVGAVQHGTNIANISQTEAVRDVNP